MEQRYKSAGVYRYSIIINGEEVHSIDNIQAQQFYNVQAWAPSQWQPTVCDATFSNFTFTNFD